MNKQPGRSAGIIGSFIALTGMFRSTVSQFGGDSAGVG
ncbi:hypothetical protein FHT67_005433 [Paenibacillus sp. BK720]|nr:hypothetical protein [Paenibacillus sp. BK720]